QSQREPQRLPEQRPDLGAAPGAVELRHRGRQRHQRASRHQRHQPADGRAHGHPGEGGGAVAAGDDVVDEADQAGGEVAGDQRRGERCGRAHFLAQARRRCGRGHGGIRGSGGPASATTLAPRQGGPYFRARTRGRGTPFPVRTMNSSPEPAAPAPTPAPRGACANCGTPLLGDHCYACGQPVKGLVRHFSSIVGDVLDSVFEWDARTPRTLWPLLAKPGYLSLEYFAGRRVRYVSPFRLFFFLAIVAFFVGRLVISADDGTGAALNIGGDSGIEVARSIEEVEQARERALAEIGTAREKLRAAAAGGRAPPRGADAALDAAETAIRAQADERIAAFREAEAQGGPPPVPRPHRISFGPEEGDPVTNPVTVEWLPDFASAWINRQLGRAERNVQRMQEEPDLLVESLLGAVPSTLFVLLPIFALMLKLAY